MFLLKNLNTKELKIVEDTISDKKEFNKQYDDVIVFLNHTANVIEEWQDDYEDKVWE